MVVLARRWAIKLPRPTSWRLFLCGLLANMQERELGATRWPQLCPVLFSLPGGWLVIMPRCAPLTNDEWSTFCVDEFCEHDAYTVPAEAKQSSFGKLGGVIVAVDYGS